MREYLKELTEIPGIASREEQVRDYIKNQIENKVDEIFEDNMGNLTAFVPGKDPSKRLMIDAHMDEVGFMITKINDDGTFGISPVGGVDPRVVKSQRLKIEGKITAVVNSMPIHLEKETSKVVNYDVMKIYAGFSNKEESSEKVNLGDMVTFDTSYLEKDHYALAKAFDDRVGCSIMLDLIDFYHKNNETPTYDTYFNFATQEETGLRGTGTAASKIKPDFAIVLEGTTAGDNPENTPDKWATHIGNGPVLTFMHSGLVLNKEIFEKIVDTAKNLGIKYQYKMRTAGGTDAARLAKTLYGIPAGVISVPCRYIHSPQSIIDLNDYENTFILVRELVFKTEF
ncbi:peptidase M42 [Petrotoga sp. 9PW.55.5.1]|uniref:M42 family metallopeptidase n=1 Tax=Petrotoga sp. 9PW.55.5.1 TaxID=1308979 RepID=UPI000DC38BEA|nr:M20/M25/M40 family metallo-hydrolase [Petrotoga sp. 9PW.55.5.1]RAO99080.1 peptidase M42 [Petrotoga sp. 9PW.55.5.1]